MFRVAHSGDSDFGAQSLKANQAFTKPAQQGATPGTSTHLAKSSQATEQLSLSLVFVLVLSDWDSQPLKLSIVNPQDSLETFRYLPFPLKLFQEKPANAWL